MYKDYLFSNEKKPNDRFKMLENDSGKKLLYKWTDTCECCYQRGHKAMSCTTSKQNKKFIQ